MPKRKAPQPDPDAFARMSRELECDESEEQFERVFARVVKPATPAISGSGDKEKPAARLARPKTQER